MLKEEILKLFKTPLSYIFAGIYFGAVIIQSHFTPIRGAEAVIAFVMFFCVLTIAMFLISKNTVKNQIVIKEKQRETQMVTIYFLCWLVIFLLFGKHILDNAYLSNGIGFWGLLVVIPFIYLSVKGYRLSDFGITKRHLSQNIKTALLACLLLGTILLFLTPGGKFILNTSEPIGVIIISFAVSFGYALLFAGFFEEFFFRGILQTRLTQYFNSDVKGILLASIIFGLYHLPFQYYNPGIANGNFIHALSNTLTEQMITAPIFGILWARTQNLIAPVMLHSLIDAISLMPRIVEKYNF
jgi:membrane protease YdiL (CAAX protease family)